MKTKICTVCQTELPADTDHFQRLHSTKDGLRTFCKECTKKKRRRDYVRHRASLGKPIEPYKYGDYEYVKARDKLIPEAEKIATKGTLGDGPTWDIRFFRAMDRLAKERGICG